MQVIEQFNIILFCEIKYWYIHVCQSVEHTERERKIERMAFTYINIHSFYEMFTFPKHWESLKMQSGCYVSLGIWQDGRRIRYMQSFIWTLSCFSVKTVFSCRDWIFFFSFWMCRISSIQKSGESSTYPSPSYNSHQFMAALVSSLPPATSPPQAGLFWSTSQIHNFICRFFIMYLQKPGAFKISSYIALISSRIYIWFFSYSFHFCVEVSQLFTHVHLFL